MKKRFNNISWANVAKGLAIGSLNLLILAACERPRTLGEGQFSEQIPNSALFDTLSQDSGSRALSTQAPSRQGVRGTTSDFTCQALTPSCMQSRPLSMFVYYANLIHSYYPEWTSHAYVRMGYGNRVVEPSIPGCSRGTWQLKVNSDLRFYPIRYENPNTTKVNTWTRHNLDIETETTGLAGLMLSFKGTDASQCTYSQPTNWLSYWYWPGPVCNMIAAPSVRISGEFRPNQRVNGTVIDSSINCADQQSSFNQTLQFEVDELKYEVINQSESNKLKTWTIEYQGNGNIYYPYY